MDGDTVEVMKDGKPLRIRIEGIDCPEKGQPYGNKAKQFTADFCFGKTVMVTGSGKYDRNKRLLADLEVDGISLKHMLLRMGYAWHFKKYSTDGKLEQLEREARTKKKGLWADAHPIPPWEWRKGVRKP